MAVNSVGIRARDAEPRYFVQFSESTINTFALVAAPGAGKRIVVMSAHFTVRTSANTISLKSATTVILPPRLLGTALPFDAETTHGLCACEVNEALNLTTTAAVATDGIISYIIED
jgi:hypothetical protein